MSNEAPHTSPVGRAGLRLRRQEQLFDPRLVLETKLHPPPARPGLVERVGLLRHLVVRTDVSDKKAERSKTIRVEDSRRRRVARGLPPDRQPGEGPQQSDGEDDDRDGYESPEV